VNLSASAAMIGVAVIFVDYLLAEEKSSSHFQLEIMPKSRLNQQGFG
jgi:hypothetical protein